jgi:hypothetical protein
MEIVKVLSCRIAQIEIIGVLADECVMLLPLVALALLFAATARAYAILPKPKAPVGQLREKNSKCSIAVFLGSGMLLS